MQPHYYTTLLLAFAIQLDYVILPTDAEEPPPQPIIDVQIDGGQVDFMCQTQLSSSGTNITCNLYIGDSSEPFKTTWTKSKKGVCIFPERVDEVQQVLQSAGSTEVSCDYSVDTDPHSLSPRSHRTKVTGLPPGPSKADEKRATPPPVMTNKPSVAHSTQTASPRTSHHSTSAAHFTTTFRTTASLQPSEKPPMPPPVTTKKTSAAHFTTTFRTTASLQPKKENTTPPPVNTQNVVILAAGIGSAVGVVVLGVTAICLCKRYKNHKLNRQTELKNESLYASVTMENILTTCNTGSTDGIYTQINDLPSTFKSPPVLSPNDTYTMITHVPATSELPLSDPVGGEGTVCK